MIEKIVELNKLNFLSVLKYVMLYFKWGNYFFLLCFLLIILLLPLVNMIPMFIFFLTIYFVGIILSLTIHEYAHVVVIKKLTTHKKIKILIGWNLFSLILLNSTDSVKSIIIAVSGALPCLFISVVLIILRSYLRSLDTTLFLLSICYASHLFSLLPFWGDGKVIFKEIIALKGGD